MVRDVDGRLVLCRQILPPLDLQAHTRVSHSRHSRRHTGIQAQYEGAARSIAVSAEIGIKFKQASAAIFSLRQRAHQAMLHIWCPVPSNLLTSTLYHGVVLARAQMLFTSCCQFRLTIHSKVDVGRWQQQPSTYSWRHKVKGARLTLSRSITNGAMASMTTNSGMDNASVHR